MEQSSSPSSPSQGQSKMLPATAKPPKSKIAEYYSIHPLWTDVKPIPQMDLDQPATYTTSNTKPLSPATAEKLASAGPALATIAYTPRYTEAMSYLRAVMANVEYSDRALALTEDIIAMNPAHYTVWIYRFRILKELWGPLWTDADGKGPVVNQQARTGFEDELKWLGRISEKNLKNYQIWHHRNSLFQLLPVPTTSSLPSSTWVKSLLDNEPAFLRSILELDTKNYHVWSYRQWLCAHFADHFLNNDGEIEAMNTMIREDVMNNSAWNHRYFLLFGSKQIIKEEKRKNKQKQDIKNLSLDEPPTPSPLEKEGKEGEEEVDDNDEISIIDLDTVDSELEYVKSQIRYAPQNGSSWNYLQGILKYAEIPETEIKDFVAEFVGDDFDFRYLYGEAETGAETVQPAAHSDENIKAGRKGVRSSQAVELSIVIFAQEIENMNTDTDTTSKEKIEDAKTKVRKGLETLATRWDPIRRRYWAWRMDQYETTWRERGL